MDNLQEIWRTVVGYEGLYEVSNMGTIRNSDGKILKNQSPPNVIKREQRKSVTLYFNGKGKFHRVHKLVAFAFLGIRPCGLVIDHIDSNPMNNMSENLRYITHRENVARGKLSAQRENKSSKFVGVQKNGKRFQAVISIGGKRKCLGTFDNQEDASHAYQNALSKI